MGRYRAPRRPPRRVHSPQDSAIASLQAAESTAIWYGAFFGLIIFVGLAVLLNATGWLTGLTFALTIGLALIGAACVYLWRRPKTRDKPPSAPQSDYSGPTIESVYGEMKDK